MGRHIHTSMGRDCNSTAGTNYRRCARCTEAGAAVGPPTETERPFAMGMALVSLLERFDGGDDHNGTRS